MKLKKLLVLDWTYHKELGVYRANTGRIYGEAVDVEIRWDEYPEFLDREKTREYPCIYINGEFMKMGKAVIELADAIREKHAARFGQWYDGLEDLTK